MTRLVLMSCVALAAAAAFAAQAAPQASAKQCFQTRDMRNHTVGDDHTLYLGVNGHDVYRVTTSDNCLAGATSSDPIVLDNSASQGRICGKMDLDIRVRGMRCIVSAIAKLSPEEAKALPKRVQP